METVSIKGREYPVKIPPQWAVREELVLAYGEHHAHTSRLQRVFGAVLGICCPDIGREARADYRAAGFDPLAYGGAVYSWLRAQGASMSEVSAAALPIIVELDKQVFPREADISKKAVFTGEPSGAKSGQP